jgi:hypothetical protein
LYFLFPTATRWSGAPDIEIKEMEPETTQVNFKSKPIRKYFPGYTIAFGFKAVAVFLCCR